METFDFEDSDLGEGTEQYEQDEQEFVEAMAQKIAGEARAQLDPLVAQRQSEAAEAQAALEAGVVQLVEEHPELQQLAVARPVVDDAHRVAVELGIPERADDPSLWREVHEARQAGARGANIAYEIAQRHAREQIVTGGNPGSRGAGCLPFGGR